ncbi:MAG: ATP-binding cassette domain-containing protein, partial [Chloroflexota bacterium]|nr:ATP-binding cassette domain-containing protein [Chloroflexota bacterium]
MWWTPTSEDNAVEVLRVDSVTGGYGKSAIVQDVSIRAEAGKIVSLVGPNGAGKSTFM